MPRSPASWLPGRPGHCQSARIADCDQTYPHRERIVKGDGGIAQGHEGIGIEVIELCNPAYKEFSSLADGKQTRKILDDNGMKCLSAHFTMDSLRKTQGQQIEWAQALRADLMARRPSTAASGASDARGSEAGRRRVQQDRGGAKKAGLQQILHNEGFENSRLEDGGSPTPVLMEYLDPDLVKMQFQMSSMRTIGDPIMFMNHPGRFISAHLQGVDTTQGMITSRAGFPPVKPTPEEAAAAAEEAAAGGVAGRHCARRRRGHRRCGRGCSRPRRLAVSRTTSSNRAGTSLSRVSPS